MRKILMIIIILLLLGLGYVAVMNGVQIGNFQVLSVKGLEEESQNLKMKIEELNNLIDIEYPNRRRELEQAGKGLKDAKDEYLQYTNLSTDEEILAAMQQKSYAIEFLWTKIKIATAKITMEDTKEIQTCREKIKGKQNKLAPQQAARAQVLILP